MRICRNCGISEGEQKFRKGQNLCSPCAREYNRLWYDKNRLEHNDRIRAYRREYMRKRREAGLSVYPVTRETFLWKAHRIHEADFDAQMRAQANECAVCNCDLSALSSHMVHVDHCHANG
jgi:hypothetical protein